MSMIHLFLWRHAEAEDTSPDLERALTGRGRRDAKHVAAALAKHLDGHARLIASPAVRARETAQPLAGKLSLDVEVDNRLAPGVRPRDVLATLDEVLREGNADELTLVLVGHQPWVGQFARRLLTGEDGDWSVKKASAWWLVRRSRNGDSEWTLRTVIDPDLL
jgi:phosphohistidine phosphatase